MELLLRRDLRAQPVRAGRSMQPRALVEQRLTEAGVQRAEQPAVRRLHLRALLVEQPHGKLRGGAARGRRGARAEALEGEGGSAVRRARASAAFRWGRWVRGLRPGMRTGRTCLSSSCGRSGSAGVPTMRAKRSTIGGPALAAPYCALDAISGQSAAGSATACRPRSAPSAAARMGCWAEASAAQSAGTSTLQADESAAASGSVGSRRETALSAERATWQVGGWRGGRAGAAGGRVRVRVRGFEHGSAGARSKAAQATAENTSNSGNMQQRHAHGRQGGAPCSSRRPPCATSGRRCPPRAGSAAPRPAWPRRARRARRPPRSAAASPARPAESRAP